MTTAGHRQVFKGELARAFAANRVANTTEDARRQTAFAIAAAFDRVQQTRPANVVAEAEWAALETADQSARFIQAVMVNMITPEHVAQMDASAFAQARQEYEHFSDDEWNERLALFTDGAQV